MGEEGSVLTPALGSWTLTLLKMRREEKSICKRRYGLDFALIAFIENGVIQGRMG